MIDEIKVNLYPNRIKTYQIIKRHWHAGQYVDSIEEGKCGGWYIVSGATEEEALYVLKRKNRGKGPLIPEKILRKEFRSLKKRIKNFNKGGLKYGSI